ncbi:MAG: hypothetical protein U1C96_11225 [Gallionella sp.]|nr:hypothetical protein [Gallionella sp.]
MFFILFKVSRFFEAAVAGGIVLHLHGSLILRDGRQRDHFSDANCATTRAAKPDKITRSEFSDLL